MQTILLINNTASSVLGFRKSLILSLLERNYKVYVIASDYREETIQAVKDLGATPVSLFLKRTGTNPWEDLKTFLSLRKKIREIQPNIVFSFFTKPVIYGTWAAKLEKVPRILAMIEGLGHTFTESPKGTSIKTRIIRRILASLYKFILPKADQVVFLNSDDPRDLLEKYSIRTKRTFVLGGIGLDLDEFPFSPPPQNPVSFIFVGRLLKEKGIREFLEAAKIVKTKYPEAVFNVVGGIDYENPGCIRDEQLKPYIEQRIINYVGHTPQVKDWLERSSVFVLPSYYREGLPRSTQEAMAMGRPIITTDTPGCRETIVEQAGQTNGFLVPKWDIAALAEKMEYFIVHRQAIATMGERSYHLAQERYDAKKVNQKIINLIENRPINIPPVGKTEYFSVLMSVFYREKPEFLRNSLTSIYDHQTLKPSEIVLVKDGPLTAALDAVITDFQNSHPNVLRVVALEKNKGLGNALQFGMEHCKNELVARMDSDDIAVSTRFEKQVRFLNKNPMVDVLGGQVEEFNLTPGDLNRQRSVPHSHNDILTFSKFRSPMNHPSVMFRKSSVLNAGNYDSSLLFWEDYILWIKMLSQGYIFHNLKECLVHFRVKDGKEMIRRRRGRVYAKNEFRFATYAYRIGFFPLWNYFFYILTRPFGRLLPENILLKIYTYHLRKK